MRNAFILCSLVVASGWAALSHASVLLFLDSNTATPGLPGSRTVTVSAFSDVPAEMITGVDFMGSPSDNNPATRRGFFGAFNQVNPAGLPTVFQDLNPFFAPTPVAQDSQFLFSRISGPPNAVNSPSGFSSESGSSLRALFARASGFGQLTPLAQLSVSSGSISFRGAFRVLRGGVDIDLPEVQGIFTHIFTGDPPPNVVLNSLGERDRAAGVITAPFLATGDPTITWSNLVQTFGPPAAIAATIEGGNAFSWDPTGSVAGAKGSGTVKYQWVATATNAFGSDTDVAFEIILIPEPATIALAFSAMLGCCGFLRRSR